MSGSSRSTPKLESGPGSGSPDRYPPVGTHATISGRKETLPGPRFFEGRNAHEDHQRILAPGVDRAVPFQIVFPYVSRSMGHRSRIRGLWEMRGAWRVVAGASDVPAVWLRRLLRQVKEQARPRAFPPNWPSLDPALQRAGYGLGVVLRGRGPSRPDMTEVLLPGLLRIAMNCDPRSTDHRQDGPKPVEPDGPSRTWCGLVAEDQCQPSAETTLSNQLAGRH
jgi:hypothetical protein